MSSSVGSLNSLPALPAEPSLDLGPLKKRKENLAKEKPLWKRDQENILYAINRVANVPSYIPRFSHIEQSDKYGDYVVPTESEVEATQSPRDKIFKQLAQPPAYRVRKKALNANHRIIHLKNYSPRLCYSTLHTRAEDPTSKKPGEISDMQKIENECMGYALTTKAKRTHKFRVQRRQSLEAAAARNEPFAIKRLNNYKPKPPPSRNSTLSDHRRHQYTNNKYQMTPEKAYKQQPESNTNVKHNMKIQQWNADSEWVKYVPTGDLPDDVYVNKECGRFENYIDDRKQQFSPRSFEATQKEEKYASTLIKESGDKRIKRIFKNYKPEFKESTYRPTYLIKLASDVYAKRLVAGRIDSKPIEVSWKIHTEENAVKFANRKTNLKNILKTSSATNFLIKETEDSQFADEDEF